MKIELHREMGVRRRFETSCPFGWQKLQIRIITCKGRFKMDETASKQDEGS